MRLLLAAAAIALLCACGAHPPAGGGVTFGTITGVVRAYPCTPVERADSPCAGRPAAHVEVDFVAGSKAPVRGITNADGVYAVQLPPDTYTASIGVLRLMNGPRTVVVKAGQTVTADFVFDSGIR